MTVALEVSFSGLLSASEVTVASLVYCVPFAALAGICATSWKVLCALTSTLAFVQVTVPPAPTAGVVQLQPALC